MAPNEKVGFTTLLMGKVNSLKEKTIFNRKDKIDDVCEKLITRGSMCGHFASGGLA